MATPQQERTWLLKEKYHNVQSPEFLADCARLEAGEPLAYVIGWADFLGCRIDLSHRPLIPRPETEYLVERAITELRKLGRRLRLLDIFSGSGCIGVALLKHLPNTVVDFGEIDPNLSIQISVNIRGNGIDESRARIFTEDMFTGAIGTYDAIFANPPYIDPARKLHLDKSVTDFEPHQALFANEAGLYYVRKLIETGAQYLNPGASLYIECDETHREPLTRLLTETPWKYEFWDDQFGKFRFVVIRKN